MSDLDEIDDLIAIIREHEDMLRALNIQLAPFYARNNALRAEIIATHHTAIGNHGPCVAAWNGSAEAKEERAGCFAELDRLASVYGKARNLVRFHALEKDAAARALKRISDARKKKA
jgi:hypothetical protein